MLKHTSIELTESRMPVLQAEHWLRLMAAIVSTIATWRERGRSRRVLAALDDHQLRGIGVSRIEARLESEKPFWKFWSGTQADRTFKTHPRPCPPPQRPQRGEGKPSNR